MHDKQVYATGVSSSSRHVAMIRCVAPIEGREYVSASIVQSHAIVKFMAAAAFDYTAGDKYMRGNKVAAN